MKKNIGRTDKILRMTGGIAIIISGAHFNSVWGVLGMIPIITSQLSTCPVYSIIGINTMPRKVETKEKI